MRRSLFLLVPTATLLAACLRTPMRELGAVPNATGPLAVASSSVSSQTASSESIEPTDIAEASSSSQTSTSIVERLGDADILEIGPDNAPMLGVFANYSCDYCRDFAQNYLPRLEQEYVAAGKLRISFITVPLQKYPNSALEASALLCAAKQQKGYAMHRELSDAANRSRTAILAMAKNLGLNVQHVQRCLADPVTADRLRQQSELITGMNVTLVPTFLFYANAKPGETPPFYLANSITGLPTYADLRGMIDAGLR